MARVASAFQASRRRFITRRTPPHGDPNSTDESSNTTASDPKYESGNATSVAGENDTSDDTLHGHNETSGGASGLGSVTCIVKGAVKTALRSVDERILGNRAILNVTVTLGNNCTRNSTAPAGPISTTSSGGLSNTPNATVTSSTSLSFFWPSSIPPKSPTTSISGTLSGSQSGHNPFTCGDDETFPCMTITVPPVSVTSTEVTATDSSSLPTIITTSPAITTTPLNGPMFGSNGTGTINPVIQIAASHPTSEDSSSLISAFSDVFPSNTNIPQPSSILTSVASSKSLSFSTFSTIPRSSKTPVSTSSITVTPITAHATSALLSTIHSPSGSLTFTVNIPGQSQAQTSNTGFFQNNKLVAGTFVGTGIILAAMLVGSVFMLLRMHKRRVRERHGERLLDEDSNEAQSEMDMRRHSSRSNGRSLLSADSTVPPIHDLEFAADPSAPMLPFYGRAPTPHTAARLSWNIPSNGSTSPVDPVDPFVRSEKEYTFHSNSPRGRVTPTPEHIFLDPNTHAAMGWILADEVEERQ